MPSTTSTSPTTTGRSAKANKKSKTLILKLPKALLNRFPHNSTAAGSGSSTTSNGVEERPKASSSSASTESSSPTPAAPAAASLDAASEPRSTPPAAGDAAAADAAKKKGPSPSKAGNKRAAGSDGAPKPRSRPGPKKKLKLDDGTTESTPGRASGTSGAHKLGPKANQGAINAGLRALDRSGKPCRKWERKTFQLKSFTGVTWQIPSWRAPPRPQPTEDTPSSLDDAAKTENSNKENNASSAVASERSNAGENDTMMFPGNTESSPAPVAAAC